ncbi:MULTISPECIES: caspase family protein [Pseudomonas]|uniref:caspase family protein n=1 Tax=Pseudomonas TaxID=286 RepID=UPI00236101D8|nr:MULTISPECIES: caspase family protein [Pseudomonas]WJV25483.1 caspase family protein [Pseudomonas chlororaphis]
MRKALIVGIDHYQHINPLSGCVNDAHSVKAALERNADGTVNFPTPRVITGTGPHDIVTRQELKDAVRELFKGDSSIALFYFAGHGYIEDTGGFLCAGDCRTGDDGLSLAEVMTIASKSGAKNKVIILDSCHSGIAGNSAHTGALAEIHEGMTILTASTADQYAMEVPGGGAGVFTNLFVDALGGAAANLLGEVTPGSVYAHIDQSLGPWAQRPVFKTNVKTFVSLRTSAPPISLTDLQALTTYFPSPDFEFELDPSFEPERLQEQRDDPSIPPPDPQNNAIFAILQRYVKVNLVRPHGVSHMWHAAMQSKSCKLTVLGQHYWRLVNKGLI